MLNKIREKLWIADRIVELSDPQSAIMQADIKSALASYPDAARYLNIGWNKAGRYLGIRLDERWIIGDGITPRIPV